MKEKIYVDGVDVSECKYYHYKGCSATGLRCENCTCYYKQLKRFEEKYNKMIEISKENLIKYEDLRLDNQKLIMEIENLKSQIDFEAQKQAILLQENEELKATIKELTQSLDDCNVQRTQLKARLTPLEDSYFNGLSSIEIAGLAKKSIRITSYNRELEHALEEIREIVKNVSSFTACDDKRLDKIQTIITEAIGE